MRATHSLMARSRGRLRFRMALLFPCCTAMSPSLWTIFSAARSVGRLTWKRRQSSRSPGKAFFQMPLSIPSRNASTVCLIRVCRWGVFMRGGGNFVPAQAREEKKELLRSAAAR